MRVTPWPRTGPSGFSSDHLTRRPPRGCRVRRRPDPAVRGLTSADPLKQDRAALAVVAYTLGVAYRLA